jgi:gamma-glutamyltranspeptidase
MVDTFTHTKTHRHIHTHTHTSALDKSAVEGVKHNSAEYLHLLIEAMRLAFADALQHVTDPQHYDVPVDRLLSRAYAYTRSTR